MASVEPNVQPFYVRSRQPWAIVNERQRHVQALFWYGEPVIFTLMWKVEDFEAGLVSPCLRCRQDPSSLEGRIQAVYQQPLTMNCPICYGTTFEGGIRAQIIRPAIFTDTDEDERPSRRGVIHPERARVESTEDFRARTGDWIFRRDGSRWQISDVARLQVRTGYEQPTQQATSIGYSGMTASREDQASVVYTIPPDPVTVAQWLTPSGGGFPDDTSDFDQINAPLIPVSEFQ